MGKPKGESRGLAYLREVRPAAIQHLLKFFGESGRHLEPKTRFLISVVTKVISSSHRGLEQYVKRALDEGARPDEIIDAVLCAYPCAGLTRVVDAIDVILDMNLPGFEAGELARGDASEPPPSAEQSGSEEGARQAEEDSATAGIWVHAATTTEIPVGSALEIVADGFNLALFNQAGHYRALDNFCPHLKGGRLTSGTLTGDVVSCPLHGWMFKLDSGECINHPGAAARTYVTRVNGTSVEVFLPVSK